MDCYLVTVPDGVRISGITASGRAGIVLPGEYVAHRLRAGLTPENALLRLVGADASGHDLHVPLDRLLSLSHRGLVSILRTEDQLVEAT